VDLYLQNENPGPDKESNWLPAPTGKFILMLRLYWPQETPPSIIDGSWKIPGVQKGQVIWIGQLLSGCSGRSFAPPLQLGCSL